MGEDGRRNGIRGEWSEERRREESQVIAYLHSCLNGLSSNEFVCGNRRLAKESEERVREEMERERRIRWFDLRRNENGSTSEEKKWRGSGGRILRGRDNAFGIQTIDV